MRLNSECRARIAASVGWVLGMVRNWSNTTVCILIHALYNILSVLLAPLFP